MIQPTIQEAPLQNHQHLMTPGITGMQALRTNPEGTLTFTLTEILSTWRSGKGQQYAPVPIFCRGCRGYTILEIINITWNEIHFVCPRMHFTRQPHPHFKNAIFGSYSRRQEAMSHNELRSALSSIAPTQWKKTHLNPGLTNLQKIKHVIFFLDREQAYSLLQITLFIALRQGVFGNRKEQRNILLGLMELKAQIIKDYHPHMQFTTPEGKVISADSLDTSTDPPHPAYFGWRFMESLRYIHFGGKK